MGPLAVYPGSFDPPTRGHEDIAKRALSFCDRLVIAVGRNSKKRGLFEVDARVEMLTKVIKSIDLSRIEVTSFEGLLVDFCRKRGASIIV
jgi:pantetheine-phosphate adenylyltransferase